MEPEELVTATGRVSVNPRSGGLVLIHVEGHGITAFAQPIMRALDEALARHGAVAAFYNMLEMPTYDSGLRTDLTAWHRAVRSRTRCLHLAARSKVVAMGVATANVALSNLITLHKSLEPFTAAMTAEEAALRSMALVSA